jgi:hypothetical protein
MKPRFNERLSRLYLARHTFTNAPFRSESDQRGLGALSILLFEGGL